MKTTATLGLNWTSSAWRRTRLTSSATGRHSKEATSPSAQRGAKSGGAAKVEGVQHVALERPARLVEAGVAPPPRRSYARGEIGGYPRLLGRLPPRLLERHLARGHAPRGEAVEQPRPRRPGGGSPSHPHARRRAPVVDVPDHEGAVRRAPEQSRRGSLDRQLRRREERRSYRELLVPPPQIHK